MLYRVERNPYYVWYTIALEKTKGFSRPDWVSDYLERVAVKIASMANHPPGKVGIALTEALEFKAEGAPSNPFKAAQKARSDLRLALEVYCRMQWGDKEYIAIENTAKKNGVPEAKARRAFKAWGSRIDKYAKLSDTTK